MTSRFHRFAQRGLAALCFIAVQAWVRADDLPAPRAVAPSPPATQSLTLDQAIRRALENNPTLRVQRQAHPLAVADVVIAQTYPFNPVLENRVQQASGPYSAGITNTVPFEEVMTLELEVRGQGKYRREAATAALSRTDWQIAFQEQTLAVQTVRAFDTLLYQQERLRLLQDTVRFDAGLLEDVNRLFHTNNATAGDRIVAITTLDTSRAALSGGQISIVTAEAALRALLGAVSETFKADGTLEVPAQALDVTQLTASALGRRPDLLALQSGLLEADATLRLAVADRYGNPSFGPAYTYDPTRISLAGVQLNVPLPVFNTHRGTILRDQSLRTQALLEVEQTEISIRQDVRAAVDHLRAAEARATMYRTQVLPNLQKALQGMRQLFLVPGSGISLLQVADVRRSLVAAQTTYLDALYEASQARADLFAAVGSLPLAAVPRSPLPSEEVLPPLVPQVR